MAISSKSEVSPWIKSKVRLSSVELARRDGLLARTKVFLLFIFPLTDGWISHAMSVWIVFSEGAQRRTLLLFFSFSGITLFPHSMNRV